MKRTWRYPHDGSEPYEVLDGSFGTPRGPLVFGDLPSYQSPIDGRWIDGRVARRQDLARSGCRPWEGRQQETQEAARRADYDQQRQDRTFTTAVERSLGQISERSRRTLLDN